jgi:hypothetical protein
MKVSLPRTISKATPILLALLVWATPRPARASVVSIDMSNVAFSGVSSCPTSPCETFNISFDWNSATHSIVPSSMNISSSGAFGSFKYDGEKLIGKDMVFVWSDSKGLILSLVTSCTASQLASGCSFNLSNVDLTCVTLACAKDFGLSLKTPFIHPNSGSVSDPVSAPEPSLLLQLILGLLFVVSLRWWAIPKSPARSPQRSLAS